MGTSDDLRCLACAQQSAGIDRPDGSRTQALSQPVCLVIAQLRQGDIAVPTKALVTIPYCRAMPHEPEPSCARSVTFFLGIGLHQALHCLDLLQFAIYYVHDILRRTGLFVITRHNDTNRQYFFQKDKCRGTASRYT